MTEKELKALLADMTLEEKVDQMNQVAAGMFSGDITAMGPMAAKLYPPEVLDRTGSVLGGMGPDHLYQDCRSKSNPAAKHSWIRAGSELSGTCLRFALYVYRFQGDNPFSCG